MRNLQLACALTLTAVISVGASRANGDVLKTHPTSEFRLGQINGGQMPKGMSTTRDGRELYVADMNENKVTILDIDAMKLQTPLKTPSGPRPRTRGNIEVEMTEDGNYALVTRMDGCGPGGNKCPAGYLPSEGLPVPMIFAIDTKTQQIVKMMPSKKKGASGGEGPKIIKIRPAIKPSLGYVANYFSDDITVLDLENLASGPLADHEGSRVQSFIKLQTSHLNKRGQHQIAPRGIAFTNDGHYALVMGAISDSIFIVDASKHQQLAELVAPSPLLNFRHIVINKASTVAYISHMDGDSVSRIDVQQLIAEATAGNRANAGKPAVLPIATWKKILIPFPTAPEGFLKLERYPSDHPNFPNQIFPNSEPNTIVLDPVNERYLYISFRTSSLNYDGIHEDAAHMTPPTQMGKIDILDTKTGLVVKSLIGGVEPTALAVTPDNRVLMSSGFRDDTIYFFDLAKILSIYESQN